MTWFILSLSFKPFDSFSSRSFSGSGFGYPLFIHILSMLFSQYVGAMGKKIP
jgi:hypothetical protein